MYPPKTNVSTTACTNQLKPLTIFSTSKAIPTFYLMISILILSWYTLILSWVWVVVHYEAQTRHWHVNANNLKKKWINSLKPATRNSWISERNYTPALAGKNRILTSNGTDQHQKQTLTTQTITNLSRKHAPYSLKHQSSPFYNGLI
jgi:hypothetical protein